jgi:hypothetical protein
VRENKNYFIHFYSGCNTTKCGISQEFEYFLKAQYVVKSLTIANLEFQSKINIAKLECVQMDISLAELFNNRAAAVGLVCVAEHVSCVVLVYWCNKDTRPVFT